MVGVLDWGCVLLVWLVSPDLGESKAALRVCVVIMCVRVCATVRFAAQGHVDGLLVHEVFVLVGLLASFH